MQYLTFQENHMQTMARMVSLNFHVQPPEKDHSKTVPKQINPRIHPTPSKILHHKLPKSLRLSFYIQARAEALRDRFVDFKGGLAFFGLKTCWIPSSILYYFVRLCVCMILVDFIQTSLLRRAFLGVDLRSLLLFWMPFDCWVSGCCVFQSFNYHSTLLWKICWHLWYACVVLPEAKRLWSLKWGERSLQQTSGLLLFEWPSLGLKSSTAEERNWEVVSSQVPGTSRLKATVSNLFVFDHFGACWLRALPWWIDKEWHGINII